MAWAGMAGLGLALLAWGSFVFHKQGGSKRDRRGCVNWGWRADEAGMYVVFSVYAAWAVGAPIWFAPVLACVLASLVERISSTLTLGGLGALMLAGVYAQGSTAEIATVAVLFALALGVRILSEDLTPCVRDLLHGLWHLLTAAGLAYVAGVLV